MIWGGKPTIFGNIHIVFLKDCFLYLFEALNLPIIQICKDSCAVQLEINGTSACDRATSRFHWRYPFFLRKYMGGILKSGKDEIRIPHPSKSSAISFEIHGFLVLFGCQKIMTKPPYANTDLISGGISRNFGDHNMVPGSPTKLVDSCSSS